MPEMPELPELPPRRFTRDALRTRNTAHGAVVIIDNQVYDVTEFLEEHPGGAEILLDNAGGDASERFHEVGHSELALDWRDKFHVGEVVEADRRPVLPRAPPPELAREPLTLGSLLAVYGPPAALAALATLLYTYLF